MSTDQPQLTGDGQGAGGGNPAGPPGSATEVGAAETTAARSTAKQTAATPTSEAAGLGGEASRETAAAGKGAEGKGVDGKADPGKADADKGDAGKGDAGKSADAKAAGAAGAGAAGAGAKASEPTPPPPTWRGPDLKPPPALRPAASDARLGATATPAKAAAGGKTATKVAEKPAETKPADPFERFGPPPPEHHSRWKRFGLALGRGAIHEYTLAVLGALLLAVVMTWPTLQYPDYTIPQDIWDPTLQAWQMAWSGHILLTDPARLWESNTFYPNELSFAFSDALIGYAPAGMIGEGPVAALVRYNIIFVLAYAMVLAGGYFLARQLGTGRIAAAVAGAAIAFAPWRLAQAGHLHVMSSGGIMLALAMLARGHGFSFTHGYRPERRNVWWALGGWLMAAWQLSLGFGIGLPFAYVLAVIAVVSLITYLVKRFWVWRDPKPFGWRLFAVDTVGGLVFAAVGALLAVPYFRVSELYPYARRSIEEIDFYSPPLSSFFTASGESAIWGTSHEQARQALPWAPEMTLLPGFALLGLAVAGLFFSVWTVWQRVLLLGGVLVSAALTMGTKFFGGTFTYVPLFEYLPGWQGIRTPGRLVLWTTIFLAILAAGAVAAYGRRADDFAQEQVPARPGLVLRFATLLPLLAVLFEGTNVTPHPVVPQQPLAMRTVDGPMLVLPSDGALDQHVMLWSTTRFQQVVNGGSGFTPWKTAEIREATKSFPDAASIQYLRDLGVKTVVVIRDRIGGTDLEARVDLPVDTLGITREDVENAVVYRL